MTSSKSKQQGTRLETAVVNAAGLHELHARRLAEGGRGDEGDVEIVDASGRRWVVECKATERLSLHRVWSKAASKAPVSAPVAVVWKRVTLKGGNERRSADGPVLVAVPLQAFLGLLRDRGVRDE